MEKMFCEVCGLEFRDRLEMGAHKGLAHETDPLGQDIFDMDDPSENIPFEKAVPQRE